MCVGGAIRAPQGPRFREGYGERLEIDLANEVDPPPTLQRRRRDDRKTLRLQVQQAASGESVVFGGAGGVAPREDLAGDGVALRGEGTRDARPLGVSRRQDFA